MDFSLALLIALGITGIIIVWNSIRLRRADSLPVSRSIPETGRDPILVEYAKTFFPVILLVLLLRSFVIEPFRIPSGSMIPSLHIGDFILVNKYAYGLRLPVSNLKILNIGAPQRGDVAVFRFPRDPDQNYIKRVIGIPGDRIRYANKSIYINGEPAPLTEIKKESSAQIRIFIEQIGQNIHHIQLDSKQAAYTQELKVPAGHYFVMGDNRDNSHDSRVWGYVPKDHLVGRAFLIWFSWSGGVQWHRIGDGIQ